VDWRDRQEAISKTPRLCYYVPISTYQPQLRKVKVKPRNYQAGTGPRSSGCLLFVPGTGGAKCQMSTVTGTRVPHHQRPTDGRGPRLGREGDEPLVRGIIAFSLISR